MATTTSTSSTDLVVEQFPCLSDNYGFLLHDPVSGDTAAIDTPDGQVYHQVLQDKGWTLTHIFNTHHHQDHVGGNQVLLEQYPKVQIYGPASERIPGRNTDGLQEGSTVEFGSLPVQILDVGGHTKGHIAYYIPSQSKAFVGDALFALGCGRMFEGTPQQFWTSLTKLRNLPDETVVYCAHEYTASNAKFALSVEPNNGALQQRVQEITKLRAQNLPTVPSTLGEEKATNPFLRCDISSEIQQNVGVTTTSASTTDLDLEAQAQIFAKVRKAKDNF
eukprot:CAMPEP_0172472894 /NCGR_PEP_ID=MMETSP1065-20121228/68581_1 /TAXON_ID=265537 /ORGANISM="Amphiprora paludosa, Strain CCMP125" /LENGTH=275 /DNA_ID=CAMNT_0013231061 /DNA_START=418 /DNA_END=1245 /DNA_ORIENTATION=-